MAFKYKILTQNGVNNTNIDGARAEYFAAGMRDGIVKGSLNECAFTAIPSNGINLDTGVLLIAGHPILITEGRSWTFTSRPSNSERRAVIAEIVVDNNSVVAFNVFEQLSSIPLTKNNMYKYENGAGTYQVEIGRFTLTTSGLVEDVVRTLDLITGGSSGMGEHFITGDITTTMLESGMQANITAEDIYNANGDYVQTNFNFEIPETAGTVAKVNNVEQANLDFTSDPQTQLNNKVDKVTGKGLSENDYTTAEKDKLAGVEAEANKTIVDNAMSSSSENPVQNKVVKSYIDDRTPVGAITGYCGTTAPSGWLFCDGSAISRTTYAALFGVIGTTYGTGDGSTTFNLPNMQGKVPMCAGTNTDINGDTGTWNLGDTGGEYNHTHTLSNGYAKINQTNGNQLRMNTTSSTETWNTSVYANLTFNNDNTPISGGATLGGTTDSHNNVQPFLVVNYIIKY